MRIQLKYALVFLALYIVLKFTIFFLGLQYGSGKDYIVFANLLFIILCSFLALREVKRKQIPSTFGADIRTGAASSVLYGLFVSLFTYVYYSWIDPSFFPNKIYAAIETAKQNPEADLAKAQEFAETIFSPFTHASITLFIMSTTGIILSIFVTVLVRRNPFS